MVKGLAKLGNRLRHVLRDKCVDASLFNAKRGYSPMTQIILTGVCGCLHWVDCAYRPIAVTRQITLNPFQFKRSDCSKSVPPI